MNGNQIERAIVKKKESKKKTNTVNITALAKILQENNFYFWKCDFILQYQYIITTETNKYIDFIYIYIKFYFHEYLFTWLT